MYKVRQGEEPEVWSPPSKLRGLKTKPYVAPPVSDKARIVLLNPVPVPDLIATSVDGKTIELAGDGEARLINLWASWCKPCMAELAEWKQHASSINSAGIKVVALNVDEPKVQLDSVPTLLTKLDLPFQIAYGSEELAAKFDVLQRSLLSRQRPLPVPSSFLIDAEGRLRIVYKGPVKSDILLEDLKLIDAEPQQILDAATPFAGRWLQPPGGSSPLQLAVKLIEAGSGDVAASYIETLDKRKSPDLSAELFNLRGAVLSDNREFQKASLAYKKALELDPENRQAHIELGTLLLGAGQGKAAEPHFVAVLRTNLRNPELIFKLALAQRFQGKTKMAKKNLRRALALRDLPMARWNLADIAVAEGDIPTAIEHYEKAIESQPILMRRANNLAWLLATSESDEIRDGRRAVEVAQFVCKEADVPTSGQLDTLAAAFASVEMFDNAIKIAGDALERAKLEQDEKSVEAISTRLELYKQKKPYRENL
jgi:tetratricopeptide (TPR) repeat protein